METPISTVRSSSKGQPQPDVRCAPHPLPSALSGLRPFRFRPGHPAPDAAGPGARSDGGLQQEHKRRRPPSPRIRCHLSAQVMNSSIIPRSSTLQSSDPRAPAMTAVRGIGGGRVRRGRAILALLPGDGGRVPRGYVPMVLVGDCEERRIMVRVRRDAQARSHGGRSGDGRAAVPSFAGSPAAPAGSSRCSAWRAKLDRSI